LNISSSSGRFVASVEASSVSLGVSSRSLTSEPRTDRAARSPSAIRSSARIESVAPTFANCKCSETS